MNSRLLQLLALPAMVAWFICGQQALAQSESHHYQAAVIQRENPEAGLATNPPPAKNLYPVSQVFVGSPYASADMPTNSDGSEIWACLGRKSPGNSDCPHVGNPAQLLPPSAGVLGLPYYTWPLANATGVVGCDQSTITDTTPCGQTNTWYEDDTLDKTDDLVYTIEATQVQNGKTVTVSHSGTIDFASPNPFGSVTGHVVILFGNQGFGTIGISTGPNNGECVGNIAYPLTSPTFPAGGYIIASNHTCKDPIAGLVTLTATTELNTPTYHKQTSKAVCGTVTPPCYTVTYTKKYSTVQKWAIWLK